MSKLLLIDGSSFLHRGYYAMPNLRNSAGEYTGAVYGLVSMLSRIISKEKPEYAVVCFDKSRLTFRTDIYAEYKGNRKETPSELKSQFTLAFDALDAMGLFVVELDNYEADDIIGTLSLQAEALGMQVDIYSGDRDLLQLVSDSTTVHLAGRSNADSTAYTPAVMQERYGFAPKIIIDMKALMGDSSDNIPGVPGVGEKTALKLLAQFGDLDNLLANIDLIESAKLQAKIADNIDMARLSYRLATICREAPISFDAEMMQVHPYNLPELIALYKRLEFRTLLRPLEKQYSAIQQSSLFTDEDRPFDESEKPLPDTAALDSEAIKHLSKSPLISIYLNIKGSAIYGDITGIGIASDANTGYCREFMGEIDRISLQEFKALLEDPSVPKLCYALKDTLLALDANGIQLQNAIYDAELAEYLLNSGKGSYPAEEVLFPDTELQKDSTFCGRCAAGLFNAYKRQQDLLKSRSILSLCNDIELPLVKVLFAMEKEGIRTDRGILIKLSEELGAKADSLTKEIYTLAGMEFNINSPKQLGEVLFEKLGIQGSKKTKTGYSTAADILEALAPEYPIISKVLEYRSCTKLKSTYADGLQKLINISTGKLHTSFKQTVTATGRLSSAEPNLQNIPVRDEDGRRLRMAFVPSQAGNKLLSADYNQIELRVLAHISGDEKLIEAFRNNEDIHTRTAMEVMSLPQDAITPELRRQAKAVNFGIVYGMSDFGLATELGITRKEAHNYINKYFERYPKVKEYQDKTIAEGKELGYVKTIYGRRRYLPDLRSTNFNIRSFAERMAINTPIQGSAADIMKIAMVKLYEALIAGNYQSKLLLQVHDELILDVVSEEEQAIKDLLQNTMQNACSLDVPLLADVKAGINWYSMEEL